MVINTFLSLSPHLLALETLIPVSGMIMIQENYLLHPSKAVPFPTAVFRCLLCLFVAIMSCTFPQGRLPVLFSMGSLYRILCQPLGVCSEYLELDVCLRSPVNSLCARWTDVILSLAAKFFTDIYPTVVNRWQILVNPAVTRTSYRSAVSAGFVQH